MRQSCEEDAMTRLPRFARNDGWVLVFFQIYFANLQYLLT